VPAVALSPAQIGGISARAAGNKFGFTLTGTNGQTSIIEVSTDLLNWQVAQAIRFSSTSTNFTDPQWTNFPARFYRVW
jgi:hypothetical protein